MDQKEVTLFAEYLEGNLSDKEKMDFENRLRGDADFKHNFEEFKAIYKTLQNQFSDERKAFKNTLKAVDKQFLYNAGKERETVKTSAKRRPYKWGSWAIAASVLLIIGFFVFNQQRMPNYADFTPDEALALTRRGVDDTLYNDAETHFNDRDFNQAITDFDKILEKEPDNVEIQYFKALSLIEINAYGAAQDILKQIESGPSIYADKAIYALALSQLKQEDYKAAKEILKKIPTSSPEYPRAKKLLKRLK